MTNRRKLQKNQQNLEAPDPEFQIPPFAAMLGRSFEWAGKVHPSAGGGYPRKEQAYTLNLIYVGVESGGLAYKAHFRELPPPETGKGWSLSTFRLCAGPGVDELPQPEMPCSSLRCSLPCYDPAFPADVRVVKVFHPDLQTTIHLHAPNWNSLT